MNKCSSKKIFFICQNSSKIQIKACLTYFPFFYFINFSFQKKKKKKKEKKGNLKKKKKKDEEYKRMAGFEFFVFLRNSEISRRFLSRKWIVVSYSPFSCSSLPFKFLCSPFFFIKRVSFFFE